MSKGIFLFIIFWIFVSAGIYGYEFLSKRQKSSMLKLLGFGALTAFIALLLLSGLVYLF
jgi:hypothetical protein